jgi:hypothetical protein
VEHAPRRVVELETMARVAQDEMQKRKTESLEAARAADVAAKHVSQLEAEAHKPLTPTASAR